MIVTYVVPNSLKLNPRNARVHPKKQVKQIASSIKAFGFCVPILVDETLTILAGHGRLAAAQLLGMEKIPTIAVEGLTPAQKRAFMLADNKLTEAAGWDRGVLAVELPELADLLVAEGLDLSITGFEVAEIDQITLDLEEDSTDPADEIDDHVSDMPPISKRGDTWQLGSHMLTCGDARDQEALKAFMGGEEASAAFLDPPFNVRVRDIVGRGTVKHAEFAMGSGEMTPEAFTAFLKETLGAAASVCRAGAVSFVCMDWRHLAELLDAGEAVYGAMLNLACWVKSNAGQGSFYRSQHEMVGIFRVGHEPHLNNIQLGRHGRNRSNVWRYSGVNTFRTGRIEDLTAHPTVKPTALVADAIKDCTRRGDIVLDTFAGSGTTILAAERVGRRAFAMEIEPKFVDVAIRRWQAFSRKDAVHAASGLTFDEIVAGQPASAQAA